MRPARCQPIRAGLHYFHAIPPCSPLRALGRRVRRSLPTFVNTLTVDPRSADVLWLGGIDGGVWRSTDGGLSFAPMLRGDILSGQVGNLVFDPADPDHPYVSVASAGVYQWRRQGWRKVGTAADLADLEAANGVLALDAEHGILYAGTGGRGVYKLEL